MRGKKKRKKNSLVIKKNRKNLIEYLIDELILYNIYRLVNKLYFDTEVQLLPENYF